MDSTVICCNSFRKIEFFTYKNKYRSPLFTQTVSYYLSIFEKYCRIYCIFKCRKIVMLFSPYCKIKKKIGKENKIRHHPPNFLGNLNPFLFIKTFACSLFPSCSRVRCSRGIIQEIFWIRSVTVNVSLPFRERSVPDGS